MIPKHTKTQPKQVCDLVDELKTTANPINETLTESILLQSRLTNPMIPNKEGPRYIPF
jgi:hypothetical protein